MNELNTETDTGIKAGNNNTSEHHTTTDKPARDEGGLDYNKPEDGRQQYRGRQNYNERGSFTGGFSKRFIFKKKFCRFCKEEIEDIDYKDIATLGKYTKGHGKILPRRFTGNCLRHQRMVSLAIKRARAIALMPYVGD